MTAQNTQETESSSQQIRKQKTSLSFINVFLLAVLALFVPLTVLVSQKTQQLKQNAQTNTNVTVDMQDYQFVPQTVTITVGQTVTWVNQGTVPHTTTSDVQATADSWDSSGLQSAQVFNETFLTAGTYPYHDTLNPQMTGTIIVTQGSIQATNTPTPTDLVPSPNCLGSCPTASVVPSTAPSMLPTSPTPTIFGLSPSGAPSDAPSSIPSIAPSQANRALSGVPSVAPSQPSTAPIGNNKNTGFFGGIIAFLLLLIELILKLFGHHR